MVAVAQLVESRIVIPVVAGSSPVSHPNRCSLFPNDFYFLKIVLSFFLTFNRFIFDVLDSCHHLH